MNLQVYNDRAGLNLMNVSGALYTLIIGALVAAVVAIGEYKYWRLKHTPVSQPYLTFTVSQRSWTIPS